MGVYKKAVITDAGNNLLTRAIAGEVTMQFSHAKTSSYAYPEGTDFSKLSDLQEVKQTVVPSNVQVVNDTLISVRALFGNENIQSEYLIQNVGLYATDGSTEILFSVCQASTADQMPVYNGVAPSSFIYNIQVTVSQASSISLSVNTAGTATAQDILELDQKKINAHGGDISDTIVSELVTSEVEFPIPEPGEETKTLLGKVKKFIEDFKNWMAGVCLIGQIVNDCVTDNSSLPLSAAQGKALMDLYTVLNTKLKYAIDASDHTYQGVDLTVRFAGEIAGYANPWRWIKARLAARNVDGLHVGDYIPIYMGDYLMKMQIAGINTYTRTTDQELGWHIDWISKDGYPDTVQWFTENNNNGTAANAAPYMKSTVKAFLDGLVAKLPAEVQEVISSKRFLLESRYSASGVLTDSTSWAWADLGKLWIPSEYEVFGSCIWSTQPWGVGQAAQYPIFANNWLNRIKGAGDGGGRASWWLLSVCSGTSTVACFVSHDGSAGNNYCSNASRVPICFRITD